MGIKYTAGVSLTGFVTGLLLITPSLQSYDDSYGYLSRIRESVLHDYADKDGDGIISPEEERNFIKKLYARNGVIQGKYGLSVKGKGSLSHEDEYRLWETYRP